jgi:hypothetical protein
LPATDDLRWPAAVARSSYCKGLMPKVFCYSFFLLVIINRHYQENEMAFLFITSQLMNIKTVFYFMGFLYLPAKKTAKAEG